MISPDLEGALSWTAVAAGRADAALRSGHLRRSSCPAADLPERLATFRWARRVEVPHAATSSRGRAQGAIFHTASHRASRVVRGPCVLRAVHDGEGRGQPRKALRALAASRSRPSPQAIATKDLDRSQVGLPEIGKRTAETIVAELHDRRSNRFVELKLSAVAGGDRRGGRCPKPAARWLLDVIEDAVAVLVQLGESAGCRLASSRRDGRWHLPNPNVESA